MSRTATALLAIGLAGLFAMASASAGRAIEDPAVSVRSLLAAPVSLDYGEAKLAIDAIVDPAFDVEATATELDGMVATVRRMLATLPRERSEVAAEKLQALRTFLYEPGWWNDNRPFRYDPADPTGQNPRAQLLKSYLGSHAGNCVSMPALFLALGERLGLDLTLSTAPLHVFVKWTDPASGATWNLETTSGAGFTRDSHYRAHLPMTDAAIANGVYMKTLSRREALSVLATAALDNLVAAGRYEEAIAVADAILAAYPAHAHALVKKGTAAARLREALIAGHPDAATAPPALIAEANRLARMNMETFAKAEALGWREPTLD